MPRQMYSKFMFLFFIRYVRNRIDHWWTVEPGNPNPRVHRSSGKLGEASFPTGTVDPRVGIFLSPLNTNDGFSLSEQTEQDPQAGSLLGIISIFLVLSQCISKCCSLWPTMTIWLTLRDISFLEWVKNC